MHLTPILSTVTDLATLKSLVLQRCGYNLYRLADMANLTDLEPMFQVLSLIGQSDPATNVTDCRLNGGANLVILGFAIHDAEAATLVRLALPITELHCGVIVVASLSVWLDKMMSASKRDSTEYRQILNLVHAYLLKAGLLAVFKYTTRYPLLDGTYLIRENQ